jgi:hypothetical protein
MLTNIQIFFPALLFLDGDSSSISISASSPVGRRRNNLFIYTESGMDETQSLPSRTVAPTLSVKVRLDSVICTPITLGFYAVSLIPK